MVRSILAVLAGFLAGSCVVWMVDLGSNFIHPPPPDFNMSDADALRSHIARAPLAVKWLVGVAWTIGPLVGAWLATWIAQRAKVTHGLIVGGLFLLMNVISILVFPLPAWISVTCIVVPPISSLAGALLGRYMSPPLNRAVQPYDMRKKNMAC
jgi:hypothetical protein